MSITDVLYSIEYHLDDLYKQWQAAPPTELGCVARLDRILNKFKKIQTETYTAEHEAICKRIHQNMVCCMSTGFDIRGSSESIMVKISDMFIAPFQLNNRCLGVYAFDVFARYNPERAEEVYKQLHKITGHADPKRAFHDEPGMSTLYVEKAEALLSAAFSLEDAAFSLARLYKLLTGCAISPLLLRKLNHFSCIP